MKAISGMDRLPAPKRDRQTAAARGVCSRHWMEDVEKAGGVGGEGRCRWSTVAEEKLEEVAEEGEGRAGRAKNEKEWQQSNEEAEE